MDSLRLDSKERLAPAWSGIGEVGQMPVPAAAAGVGATTGVGATAGVGAKAGVGATAAANDTLERRRPLWRTLLRALLRAARDAAIGLALITAVPVGVVVVRGVPLQHNIQRMADLLAQVEPFRALTASVDPAITPMQAGLAMHALNRRPPNPMFPTRAVAEQPSRPWESSTLPVGRFAAPPGANSWRGPSASDLMSAAASGFTTEEMGYLRAIADSPVWRDVNIVASAAQVDLIGGAYELPFLSDARVFAMPGPTFADTKSLANAAIARAAYYLAIDEPEQAEAALRAVVSLGFAYIDNGENVLHALVGRVIVGMAQNGLHALYLQTRNAPGLALTAPFDATDNTGFVLRTREELAAQRAVVLAHAGDPTQPRSIRLEQVMLQSLSSCESLPSLLFGAGRELSPMYEKARSELARFPAERAYVDLLEASSSTLVQDYGGASSIGHRLVMGAATVAGTVLRNPRLEVCTQLALDNPF